MGVPQYRFRETFQSRAFLNHPPNRPSRTFSGTLQEREPVCQHAKSLQCHENAERDPHHRVFSLLATNLSLISSTLTNQTGMAR